MSSGESTPGAWQRSISNRLACRIEALSTEAAGAERPSVAANVDWNGGRAACPWLWDRLKTFDTLPSPASAAASHFQDVLKVLDVNELPFPQPPLSNANLLRAIAFHAQQVSLGDVPARQVEALGRLHKEKEVRMWGVFNVQPFVLPGTDVENDNQLLLHPGAQSERAQSAMQDALAARATGLATAPGELRCHFYGQQDMDMALPEGSGAGWARWALLWKGAGRGTEGLGEAILQSAYGEEEDVIRGDICTEEQLHLIERRGQMPGFWKPERIRARAEQRGVLAAFLDAHSSVDVLLDREETRVQWRARLQNEKAALLAAWEDLAVEGAKVVTWLGEAPAIPLKVHARKSYFNSDLIKAIRSRDVSKVEEILSAPGPRVQVNRRALELAVSLPKSPIDSLVLKPQEADVDCPDENTGLQPLRIAFLNGTEYLLHVQPTNTVEEVQEHLMKATGNPSVTAHCLKLASQSGEILHKLSIQISEVFGRGEDWSLSAVVENYNLSAMEISRLLLQDEGVRLKMRDNFGWQDTGFQTRLVQLAANAGNEGVIKIMMQSGLDTAAVLQYGAQNCRDLYSRSPSSRRVVESLLRCGVDPEREVDKALRYRYNEILELLLGPHLREELAAKFVLLFGLEAFQVAVKHHPALAANISLWRSYVSRYGFARVSSLIPQCFLSSPDHFLSFVSLDIMALKYAPESFKDDEGFLLAALSENIMATDFIAHHAWTPSLASAAGASGLSTGFAHLNSEDWSHQLALEYIQYGFEPTLVPEAAWTTEMVITACQKGLLTDRLWRIPDELWTEDLVLACSSTALPLFPKELWSAALASKLAARNWQCLTWAPVHILQDQALREQLIRLYHCKCVEYQEYQAATQGTASEDHLVTLRELVSLGMAVKHQQLFLEEHDWRLVSKQVALRARFEVSLLACSVFGGHPEFQRTDDATTLVSTTPTLQEVRAKVQMSEWKLSGLKGYKSFPKSCTALLRAVSYCLAGPNGEGRDLDALDRMVADSAQLLKQLMSVSPSNLTLTQTTAALDAEFLDSPSAGRSLQAWAAKDVHGAYAIAGLAAWLRGILGLSQLPRSAKPMQVTAELMTMHRDLKDLQEEAPKRSYNAAPEEHGAELKRSRDILEASELLVAAMPSAFPEASPAQSSVHAYAQSMLKTECEKANTLRESTAKTVRSCEEKLAASQTTSIEGVLPALVSSCA
eukprot:CAMPEP_0197631004 /NCGR_PEP_ID=MMETSP1338-20131121/8313_1 /TAXON_ID=43686 ORGANISM="Pelagodinium beii, Strain RCC1491" /NCGR_SAMPLE_ID=MMETSP1338 /ASSEMBLY_ACC=CAM_ASM_000754 /LENGTH=1198 /DNA_ID=CAMNT_0043202367 /DNA_START=42 /DNA_END=3638 /DNA_ORIENTATION=+